MQASNSLELLALKAELQSSLARLGLEPVSSDSSSSSVQDVAPPRRPVTRWNRRRLMREVAAASERRRELERQLQTEMNRGQQQELEGLEQQQQQQGRRRAAWQAAIAELQQQRADIQRQMEQEAAADAEMESYAEPQEEEEVEEEPQETQRSGSSAVHLGNNESVSETQYSIGGVVTLEPLSSTQRQASSARTGLTFRPAVAASGSTVPEVPVVRTMEAAPRVHYRNTPDALNDVFSLQLKFAETMLKLEKSVQMRDQLLHHGGVVAHKRRAGMRTREENDGGQRGRQPHRKRSFESGSCSDASVDYRESRSYESFSSSAYSFSSLDSTPRRGTTIRMRYPNFGVSRATTAETLAPSSSGVDNLPGLGMNGGAPPVSSTNTTLSQQGSSPDTLRGTAADSDSGSDHAVPSRSTDERPDENHRTPTTGSSVTTPTTRSDQKSTASSSKQVRFGDDAYSTPVLARKFNFDGLSIDEDEEEEKEEESVLSFLGGSSVTSAELNDASFVRAFERFRRELNAPKHNTVTQSPVQQPLARELFPVQDIDRPEKVAMPVLEAAPTDSTPDAQDQTVEFPELEGLSVEELQERRRQLCLDIQSASAQLVLNFGGVQSRAEDTTDRLMSLRDELKAVDELLSKLS